MKTYSGNLWTETDKDGILSIGFTQDFINEKMLECFHVIQADKQSLTEKGPMLVIETNDGLESIQSPVTGTILTFNDKARNFPDRLTENDTILSVLPKGIVVPTKNNKAHKVYTTDPVFTDVNIQQFQEALRARQPEAQWDAINLEINRGRR